MEKVAQAPGVVVLNAAIADFGACFFLGMLH